LADRITLLVLLFCIAPFSAFAGTYTEDFTTTAFKDSLNTTADWNTVAGELGLFPFSPATVGSVDTPGNARALAVAGDYAFVTDASSGLQVIDVSDVTAPGIAGTYGPANNVQDVALHGDYAYLADGSPGLLVVDIADPTTPTLVGFYNPATTPDKVAVVGNLAVIGVGLSGIEVLDLSSPTSPTLLGSFNTAHLVADLFVEGSLVFVADFNSGLQIIDISNPSVPTLEGAYDTPGSAFGVFVDGNYAYVADGSAGLQIIDVTDPTSPSLVGTVDTPGSASKVVADGDRVFVADGSDGLQVVDVHNPAAPTIVQALDTPGTAAGIEIAGEHAFVADSDEGLRIIRVAEASRPVSVAGLSVSGRADGVEVSGNLLYSASSTGGLRILDVTDPDAPVEVGNYVPPGAPKVWDVSVSGDLAALAADTAGIILVDISDASSPASLSTHPTEGTARTVDISGGVAYFGASGTGFGALDISNPSAPVLLDSLIVLNGFPGDIEIAGATAFFTSGTSIYSIDITNPSGLVLLDDISLCLCSAGQISVAGDNVLVGAYGLVLVDATNPAALSTTSVFDPGAGIAGVDVTGDVAILGTSGTSLLYVLDISDPLNPGEIGVLDLPGSTARRVAVSGHHAFVGSNSNNDIQIVRFLQDQSDPANNSARSVAVDDADDVILKGRVVPSETPGISWELSADNGLNFQSVVAGEWATFVVSGTDLIWRSSLEFVGQSPKVTDVTVEWLNDFGEITAVGDVPNDQGRQVRVEWRRSAHDFIGDPDQIVEYAVYRKIDPALSGPSPTLSLSSDSGLSHTIAQHAATMQAAGWDFLTTVPVRVEDDYAVIVPTLADSTITSGLYMTTFMVSALTATPGVFFDSYPDSGYSVDNLAPGVPQGLAAIFGAGAVDLSWDPAPEPDFQYFRVYRDTDPGFVPGPGSLVHETTATSWQDSPVDPGEVFYKITALDHAGNESDPASSGAVTAVGDGLGRSAAFALRGAMPNPLRAGTRIAFDLPVDAAVSVDVFDIAGRLVRSVARETLPAGHHEIAWNGADNSGHPVVAGVYFYRLRAGTFEATRRLVIIR
jgi:hypothetical protein